MKLIAYVSDENYLALSNVAVELESMAGRERFLTKSSARGAVYADIPPGNYRATLSRDGYGAKWVVCHLGSGDPYQFRLLSDCLLGFMWPKWVRSGEASEIRCHSPEQYQLTLWRYGFKKEFVRMLGWYDEHGPRSTVQITPDGDYSQVGVSWNKWGYPAPHVQQFVGAPARSGLYYLWARTRGLKTFSFPWVIAPREPSSTIAVLASTNTWNAYNNFGGRSNYVNSDGLPPAPTVNARQDLARYTSTKGSWSIADEGYKPLAFERPEPGNDIFDNPPWDDSSIVDPIQGRTQCGQAPGEWRLLGWMEREGFAYDYYSEAQLHDGVLPLEAYKILITSVHPEYWTREMFARVDVWIRAQGGRLIYLGGNGVNCEVTLEANATMRCLSFDDSSDPVSGHQSRIHRTFKPEASLLGVAFTERGVMTAAPYRTLAADHWVFAGTGLSNGELFGEKSLHQRVSGGASGHETDKITPSSPENLQHLAQGINPDEGGADMVYFEQDRGAVFSVGSITWVSSLFPDERVSRITRNVIERFLLP